MIAAFKKIIKNESGTALLATLAVISVLIAAGLHLSRTTGDSVLFTSRNNDHFVAKQKALSAIALAKLILIDDAYTNQTDSVQESWADPQLLTDAVDTLGFKPGSVRLTIEDETGKLPINALISGYPGSQFSAEHWQVFERFFNLKIKNDESFKDRDVTKIMNSLKDWLDSQDDDAVTGISGAESEHYMELPVPYLCANRPFRTVQTLLLVNGLNDPSGNDSTGEAGLEQFDFGSVFTVNGAIKQRSKKKWYKRRININTAPVDVLAALLPDGMEDMAAELAAFRNQKQQNEDSFINTLDNRWVEQVIQLSEKEKRKLNRLVTYSSDTFKIVCQAQENDTRLIVTVFVKRLKNEISGEWTCNVIQMEQY